MLFDDSQSLDSDEEVSINYQSGSVSGDIFWEQVTLDTFQIGYQAFSKSSGCDQADSSLGGHCHQPGFGEWKLHRCTWSSL